MTMILPERGGVRVCVTCCILNDIKDGDDDDKKSLRNESEGTINPIDGHKI